MKFLKRAGLFLLALFLVTGISENTYAENNIRATATAVASDKIELSWSELEEAGSYNIYRRAAFEESFRKMKSTKNTSYQDSSVSVAVIYYYKIVPVSRANGKEIRNALASVKTKTPQKVVIEKIQVKSPTELKLYWKPSSGSSGYQVLRSDSEIGRYEEIAKINGRTTCEYTDETVIPGRTYYYKIRPTNQGQTGFGSYSAPVKGRTIAKTDITSIQSVTSEQMKLTWKKVAGAKTYEIYRSTSENGGYKKIATVKSSIREYTDKTVKSGKKYYYKIVVTGSLDGVKITSGYSQSASFRTLGQANISSVKPTLEEGLLVKWGKVNRATKYKVYRSTLKRGTYKQIATVPAYGASVLSYTDNQVKSGQNYYYKIQAYSEQEGIISAGSGTKSVAKGGSTSYAIMGKTSVTIEQMMQLYQSSGRSYPSRIYKGKGAKNLEKFCEIVLDECEKEGVKAEVIFAQICLETGFLQFGGQVKAEQCNFAGLGATDDGASGATFPSVEVGIRAQVQHLKGYASTEDLNQVCVDPRFIYLASRRGTAKYVQSLGNGNWATDPDYASKLMRLMKTMKSY